jgi:hypothetical protein
MQPKLTDWFPPDVKPVRVGWYESPYQYWTHSYWCGTHWTESSCDMTGQTDPSYRSAKQKRKWRGLAEKPE